MVTWAPTCCPGSSSSNAGIIHLQQEIKGAKQAAQNAQIAKENQDLRYKKIMPAAEAEYERVREDRDRLDRILSAGAAYIERTGTYKCFKRFDLDGDANMGEPDTACGLPARAPSTHFVSTQGM